MENAKVYINGKMTARTDTEGEYRIFNITSGTYKIQARCTCTTKLHYIRNNKLAYCSSAQGLQ